MSRRHPQTQRGDAADRRRPDQSWLIEISEIGGGKRRELASDLDACRDRLERLRDDPWAWCAHVRPCSSRRRLLMYWFRGDDRIFSFDRRRTPAVDYTTGNLPS